MLYIFSILALIGFVINSFGYAWLGRKYHNFETAFFRSFFLAIVMLPLLVYGGVDQLSWDMFLQTVVIGIIGAVGFFIQLESYKYLPVGVVASLIRLYNIPIIILGFLVYGETLSALAALGVVVLLGSGVLLGLQKNNHDHLQQNMKKGLFLVFLRIITFAIWTFGFAYFTKEINVFTGAYLAQATVLIGFIFFAIYFKLQGKQIFPSISSKFLGQSVGMSIFPAISTFCMFQAMSYGNISFVTLFLSSSIIFIAIVSHFLFHEHLSKKQWFLIFTSFVGLILINL